MEEFGAWFIIGQPSI